MKIIYVGRDDLLRRKLLTSNGDILLLLYDRWDDFGFKTRFPTDCRIGGEEIELGAIRILFEDESASHSFLTARQSKGWNGQFPLNDVDYISVPEQITFYEQLLSLLPKGGALEVARALRDASFLSHIAEDASALALIGSRGFRDSLQRERAAQKSFTDGWKLLNGQTLNVADLTFDFRDPLGNLSRLELKFESESRLPHDVNIVIGPNGVGKSSMLRQMVQSWVQPKSEYPKRKGVGFDPRPNLSQLLAVSYSPFERLPVDTDNVDKNLKDKDIYRFFGFRGRRLSQATGKRGTIRHSLGVPRENAARSLIQCLTDDMRFSTIPAWANKLGTLHRVLNSAIQFDVAAVRLQLNAPKDDLIGEYPFREFEIVELTETDEDGKDVVARYVPIVAVTNFSDAQALLQHVDLDGGVAFFKNGQPLHLSSGQRLFFYIVVNILGVIRRNSLVLVDEPELFLHPTLEVQFVSMLKQILQTYGSKALLATHSVVTVREVPSSCVHVLARIMREGRRA